MYADEGATATDDIDGDITDSLIVGGDVVDVNTAGAYIITYNVSDEAGNSAVEVSRTVNVVVVPVVEVVPEVVVDTATSTEPVIQN